MNYFRCNKCHAEYETIPRRCKTPGCGNANPALYEYIGPPDTDLDTDPVGENYSGTDDSYSDNEKRSDPVRNTSAAAHAETYVNKQTSESPEQGNAQKNNAEVSIKPESSAASKTGFDSQEHESVSETKPKSKRKGIIITLTVLASILLIVAALIAFGKIKIPIDPDVKETDATVAVTSATEKATAAPHKKPTEAPSEKPTEAPTEKPTEAPTATKAPKPELESGYYILNYAIKDNGVSQTDWLEEINNSGGEFPIAIEIGDNSGGGIIYSDGTEFGFVLEHPDNMNDSDSPYLMTLEETNNAYTINNSYCMYSIENGVRITHKKTMDFISYSDMGYDFYFEKYDGKTQKSRLMQVKGTSRLIKYTSEDNSMVNIKNILKDMPTLESLELGSSNYYMGRLIWKKDGDTWSEKVYIDDDTMLGEIQDGRLSFYCNLNDNRITFYCSDKTTMIFAKDS